MSIAQLYCRRQRSDLGQKGVEHPLDLLPCRVDSKWRTESGTEGTTSPSQGFTQGQHNTNFYHGW